MIHVIKASGEREPFSEEKLFRSITHAGIPPKFQSHVVTHIKEKLYDNIPSSEIYQHITKYLETSPHPFAKSRYSLKQAIMELGPTGYPFEDYVAKILTLQGYSTQTRQLILGKCVMHEIDVIAERNTVLPYKIMVEAKFHNAIGIRSNIHVSLYTKARFDDIKEKYNFHEVWLITNTKATIDAITYAKCVGMKIVTWSYPEGESLRDWVEKYHLFPITSLITLTFLQKQQLLTKGIVLCKDICEDRSLLDMLELPSYKKAEVADEVEFICQKKID